MNKAIAETGSLEHLTFDKLIGTDLTVETLSIEKTIKELLHIGQTPEKQVIVDYNGILIKIYLNKYINITKRDLERIEKHLNYNVKSIGVIACFMEIQLKRADTYAKS